MKSNYTYNLMRDTYADSGGLFSEIPSYEKLYHECTEQRHQLKQQIKDQQELIEAAVNLLSCVPTDNNNIYLVGFKEHLESYTQKLNHFNQTYNNQ